MKPAVRKTKIRGAKMRLVDACFVGDVTIIATDRKVTFLFGPEELWLEISKEMVKQMLKRNQ